MNFVAKALNLSKAAAERLAERNILRRAFVKHSFFPDIEEAYRLDKKFGYYEDGTVVVKTSKGELVIRGFPKIRRALTLSPTLEKHFGSRRIAVEEKMNGYNVRIVKIGENLYAITRRGLICPYTTQKAREKIPVEFFLEYPDHMLCCEAVGEASPYVPSNVYGISDLEFFLFDIRECRTNEAVSVDEKEEIAKRYGLKMAEVLLKTSPNDFKTIRSVVEDLSRRGREGVVFKDIDMVVPPVKYTTSYANCSDLSYAFRYFMEYARDFMIARIVREAFQAFEFGESGKELDERCLRLGRSVLLPMVESIKAVRRGEDIVERTKLVFSSYEVLELFKKHLRLLGVDFRVAEVRDADGKISATFERVMRSTTDKIAGILNGSLWR